MLGVEDILSSVGDQILMNEVQKDIQAVTVKLMLDSMVSRVETRGAERELDVVRHAHKTALLATKRPGVCCQGQEEATDYIISKLAELEGETKQKLMKEMEGNDQDRHQKVEQMKALLSTEIERQKSEITTLKTKYIAEKFEHTADKTKAKRDLLRVSGLVERGQVHLVLNDVVSSVVLQDEQSKVKVGASRKHYQMATSSQMAQLGNMGNVNSMRDSMGLGAIPERYDPQSEESFYGMSGSSFDKTAKRKPGPGGESISDLFKRAKAEIAALTSKYNDSMSALKAQRDKRREAKNAVKNWLSDFEKKTGRPATMDDRKQAQDLFVAFRL